MGIYIKNMEMPKSCWDCFACHDGWCVINQKIEGHRTVTHSCQLIEVPKHGRLIDSDALIKLLDNCMFPSDMVTTRAVSMARNWLIDAPTIIESEGE